MRPRITQQMRALVAERYGCRVGERKWIECHYCPSPILIDRTDPRRTRFLDAAERAFPELDHVEPLHFGGAHSVGNLVPSCLSCNRSKGTGMRAAKARQTLDRLPEL